MSSADLILTLLDKQKLDYQTLRAPDAVSLRENWLEQTVPLASVARLAILQDKEGVVLAFYPADRIINLYELQTILHRDLRFVASSSIANHLKARLALSDYQLNNASGVQIIIDEHLTNQELIHFEAPQACTLLRVKSLDLQHLGGDILIGGSFSELPNKPVDASEQRVHNLKDRIARLDRLPAMPDMPSRILAIRNDPNSTVDQLVTLVEQDLSLSAQTLRYANSSIFATRDKVVSLKDAIFRVLGYETVLHLALGYALGRVFKLPYTMMAEAERLRNGSPVRAAVAAQMAIAIAIESAAPVRLANLTSIRLDTNLIKPGGPNANYWLVFPKYDAFSHPAGRWASP